MSKSSFVSGAALGIVCTAFASIWPMTDLQNDALEKGRQIGLCESKGGRMVDGVCGKFEVMK